MKTRVKLDSRLSIPFCRDYELFGREFPRHLQIAYGRYVAKLMFEPKARQPKYTFWLRDLPLNVWDLEALGFRDAARAFEAESRKIRGVA